jgi:hypothetical protein
MLTRIATAIRTSIGAVVETSLREGLAIAGMGEAAVKGRLQLP